MSLLSRNKPRTRQHIALTDDVNMSLARVHEICGPSRIIMALAIAARRSGPVLWIRPGHERAALNPAGIAPWFNPGRIVIAAAYRPADLLWSMEEGLRSGAAPVVIAELPEPPRLTPVRRLNLAAEAGGQDKPPPIGLMLTPEYGGAPGVESRWHLNPLPSWVHCQHEEQWHARRTRARMAAELSLTLRYNAEKGQSGFTQETATAA